MPQLWQITDEPTGDWQPLPLDPQRCYPLCESVDAGASPDPNQCVIWNGKNEWVLLAGRTGPRVTVNGDEVLLGARVLADRDEIVVATGSIHRYFFSAESSPVVETFTPRNEEGIATRCPRCIQPIESGKVVCCPSCGVWHHQTDESPCWSYGDTCGACHEQPTDLDAEFRFHPREL